jgi:hypothetical protein
VRSNLASHAFASNNGFDPSRFYGDEEEEEEEEHDDGNDHATHGGNEAPWAESRRGGTNGSTAIVGSGSGSASIAVAPNRAEPMPVARSNDMGVSFNSTLTEDQLLDLFGVAPPPTSAPSVVSTPPHATSPRGDEPSEASQKNAPESLIVQSRVDVSDFTLPDDDDDASSSSGYCSNSYQ